MDEASFGSRSETDAVIIGAGPAGLFSVFEMGMARMKCHVVDALDAVGGRLTALYPEKPVYDIPGFVQIPAGELVERLAAQAAPFKPEFHLGVTVETLVRLPDGRWEVVLSDNTALIAPVVVVAAGAGAFGPNRPPLADLDRYEGESIRYYVRRRDDLAGKRIVIAGGGDSAVDWAISLAEIADKVMVVHRRAKFRAAPASEARLLDLARQGQIDLVVPYQLAGLDGEAGRLREVVVADLDGRKRSLPTDVLLLFFGIASHLGPIERWGFAMEEDRIVVDPATMATTLPGIFALGDIAVYPGKLKLILQGFAEAAVAARAAYPLAHDGTPLHFTHSSASGVPAP